MLEEERRQIGKRLILNRSTIDKITEKLFKSLTLLFAWLGKNIFLVVHFLCAIILMVAFFTIPLIFAMILALGFAKEELRFRFQKTAYIRSCLNIFAMYLGCILGTLISFIIY